MNGVLSAEGAVLVHLQTVGVVLLVLVGVVVSLLALRTPQGDLYACAGLCHTFGTSFNISGTSAFEPTAKKLDTARLGRIQQQKAQSAPVCYGEIRQLPPCVPKGEGDLRITP